MTPKIKKTFPDPNSIDGQILAQISQALYNKEPLSGPDGIITKLLKQAMEATLEGEIDSHFADNSVDEHDNRGWLYIKVRKVPQEFLSQLYDLCTLLQ